MVRAVLFDAAETLFRVRGSVGAAYAAVAARHGVAVSAAEIETRFRAAFGDMPAMCFPGVPEAELPQRERAWWRRVVNAAFGGYPFAAFETFFCDLFEHFARADAWELFADVEPALTELRARGMRLGVVSNFDGRLVGVCEGLGIANRFDTIVMSGRVACAKPDPKIFGIALERLGVAAADALHVGDSETDDLRGAHAAGLRAILIRRESPAAGRPDRVGDLRELINHL
ncbi:MAG: HAD-IA family hydrolase [Candidatus Binatia bacterium]